MIRLSTLAFRTLAALGLLLTWFLAASGHV